MACVEAARWRPAWPVKRIRGRSGALAAGLVSLAGATASHAAVWKDGCPAYFPPEDVPAYTHDLKIHEGSAAFGALPEIDSLLGPTRVALELWRSAVRPENGPPPIADELGGRLVLQGNLTSGPMFGAVYAGYAVPDDVRGGSDAHLGNLTLFVGYRHTGYLLGPLFRTGFAIRVAGGGPLTARTAASFAGQREEVAISSPFRSTSFGIEVPFTATLEYRIEAVGCRAPFADLRVDLARWRVDGRTPSVMDAPIELALGAYPWEPIALFAAVGEELRSSALRYTHLTRITLGAEWHLGDRKHVRIGARASAITGGNVGGIEIGVTLAWLTPLGGSFE
jgi:hypothetical protein